MLNRLKEWFEVSSDRCQTLLLAFIMDGMLIQPLAMYLNGFSIQLETVVNLTIKHTR